MTEDNEHEWVTVAVFENHGPALLAKSVLDSADIPCWLRDEHLTRMIGLHVAAFGGIKLQVRPADHEQAIALLQQTDAAAPSPESGD